MNQQKLARMLKFYPIFFIGLAAGISTHIALERGSLGMMLFFLGFGVLVANSLWKWLWAQFLLDIRETAKTATIEALKEEMGITPNK